jgi:transglutaminase-like putative cysteine protease
MMRTKRTLLCGAVAFAATLSTPAGASWFSKGQPVPDWGMTAAKTPTPGYAKDADDVILFKEYVETVDAQGRAVERERRAIRILKPQGRHYTCDVSYDEDEKLHYFRAWTIAPDEKTYQAQDSDFAEVGESSSRTLLYAEKRRVVHLPALDVGAVEVCESEKLLPPYAQEKVWFVQDDIPVVFHALEVDLPAGMPHLATWHNHNAVTPAEAEPNHLRWEVKDMSALTLRDIPSRPSWSALAARVAVEWGEGTVQGIDDEWRALGAWTTKLEAGRPDPSPEITAETQQLIAGAPDFYTKLTRITEYIQKNIRYFIVVRGIGGMQAHPAAEIFHNRYGDCKDKTTLLISMLQVAGIHAYYVPVDDRRGVVDPQSPSTVGDHMITAIEVPAGVEDKRLEAMVKAKDGRRFLIFDPTNTRTPAGNLPSYLQGGYGLLSTGQTSQVIELPVLPPSASGTEIHGAFSLAADGTLSGAVDALHFGPEGADWPQFLKETDEKERHDAFETYVAHDLPGMTLNSFEFVQPQALDKPLECHFKVTAPGYAHTAGPILLVRPRVVGSHTREFDNKPRTVPIDLDATGRWHDSFDIMLPTGYVVDETPDAVDIDSDFASYHAAVTVKGSALHYERTYEMKKVELPASRADEFRKLESAILSDERGTAVLKKQ